MTNGTRVRTGGRECERPAPDHKRDPGPHRPDPVAAGAARTAQPKSLVFANPGIILCNI